MSALHQQIGKWLGLRVPRTEQELVEIVEHQLPTTSGECLLALGLTRSEVDSTVIHSRTLQHRRSRHEKLSVEGADRVPRIMRSCPGRRDLWVALASCEWFAQPNSPPRGPPTS